MRRSLIATNPYLRDPEQRRRAILLSVATSSAVEGFREPLRDLELTARKRARPSAAKARPPRGKPR